MRTAQQILAQFTSQTKLLTTRETTPAHVTAVAPHQPTDHIQKAVASYTGSLKNNAGVMKN
jgi:hypothetical protein